jgi:hypothetical protein
MYKLAALILLNCTLAQGFTSDQTNNSYLSDSDSLLTIHKLSVLPATDNVKGLFARYVEKKLETLVKQTHRFDFAEVPHADPLISVADYENDSDLIKKMNDASQSDAYLVESVMKRSDGLDLTLDLFLSKDGALLAQESISRDSKFIVTDLEKLTAQLYAKLLTHIPYKGLVLSRQGNDVTLDLGSSDGISKGTIVDVEQIISVKRHPRYKFLLSTEKEILGKIKIIKADETLSFGEVIQEKQKGVVAVNGKITNIALTASLPKESTESAEFKEGPRGYLPKDAVTFGKNPREWLPEKQPSLGKVNLSLGLGSLSNNLTTQNSNFSGSAPIYPQLQLSAEVWITQNWYVNGLINQGIFSVSNPQNGSAPSTLNANSADYKVGGGYKYLFEDFYGPQLHVHGGYGNQSFFIDSSSPISFSSLTYSGLYAGIGGSFPVTPDRSVYIDANLDKYLFSNLTETPISSAASSNSSVTSFSVGGFYRMTNQFWLDGHVNFDFFSASYSGTGTRADPGLTTSQNLISLLTGIDYLY